MTPSGVRSSFSSCKDFCNRPEVLDGSCASRFRLSKPCLAASRWAGVGNIEVEERRPIDGRGMISDGNKFSILKGVMVSNEPELNGTTEENGEYGRASSTVRTLALLRLVPFEEEVPFDPLGMPFCIA